LFSRCWTKITHAWSLYTHRREGGDVVWSQFWLALFGKPGKKSGYVLLRVEFDGSLRDETTTTTKKGKENCQDDAEMSLHTKLE
jgi:hypothetical protein